MVEAVKASRSEDVWIEETSRPYTMSVQEMVGCGGARRFNVDVDAVEQGVFQLMLAVENLTPDAMLMAVTTFFILMVRRFGLRLTSVLKLGENYLSGLDPKPMSRALMQLLADDFENVVTHYETYKLSKAVNATEVLNRPKNAPPPDPTVKQFYMGPST